MADTDFMGMLFTGLDGIWTGLKYVLLLLLVAGICFWIINKAKYNKIIIVKKETGTHNKVLLCKAKQIKKKDGTIMWLINRIKKETTPPPKDAIDLDDKGHEVASCTYTQGGDVTWQTKDMKGSVVSLSPEERTQLAYQFLNAGDWKKTSILDLIKDIAPFLMVTMFIVCMFAFWGEYMQPAIKLSENVVSHDKLVSDQLQILQEIKQNVVRLTNENTGIKTSNTNKSAAPS